MGLALVDGLLQTLEDLSEIAAEPFINILANACRGIAVVKQTGRCGSDHVLYGVPGAPLDHLEMLVEAPRLRLSLYRSADDRKGAPYPARRIAQAGYDSENLILAQAGLAEQAFLYMDMNDPHSAMRALDKQEQFCRRLGDPERLAVCLINNAVVGGRDRRTGLAKPKEAQAPGQGLARWGYRDLTGIKKCDAIPRRERQR